MVHGVSDWSRGGLTPSYRMGFLIGNTKLCTPDNMALLDQHLEYLTEPLILGGNQHE